MPRDLFFAETRDVEVWLGFEVRGAAALATAPLHWAIFALGAWGFWRCRPWVLPSAGAYVFYVAVSHIIWSESSPNGHGWRIGLLQGLAISIPGILLLRARAASPGVGRHPDRVPQTGSKRHSSAESGRDTIVAP